MITAVIIVSVIIGIAVILCVLYRVMLNTLCNFTVKRRKEDMVLHPDEDPRLKPYKEAVLKTEDFLKNGKYEKCEIESFDGLKLSAKYFEAENGKATVVMMHGYTAIPDNDVGFIAEYLLSRGYNLLIPRQRSHGESEGEYMTFGALEAKDCADWCRYIDKFRHIGNIFIYGVSMGASTVMLATAEDLPETVRGYIADCGFTSGAEIIERTGRHNLGIWYNLFKNGVMKLIRKRTGVDMAKADCRKALARTKLPGLFFCGEEDKFVPLFMTEENFKAAGGEKKLLSFPGAVHAQCALVDPERYREEFTAFLEKYTV